MPFPGVTGSVAASAGGSPLDYTNLVAFWESETNVVESAGEVTSWTDQSSNAIALTQLGSQSLPDLETNTQNGFDGVSFEEFIAAEPINKKLGSADSALDNTFLGVGFKAISFAARWDRSEDFNFGLGSTICSKGYSFGKNVGWQIRIDPAGSLLFEHYMDDGSSWQIEAAGFYNVGDLVLGSIEYTGGNNTGSGRLRLWNGTSFVQTGTVTTATSSEKEREINDDFVIGNIYDPLDTNDNQPFEGPMFGIWITKPSQISLDDAYMTRWIP